MRGKRKIAALLRSEGFAASALINRRAHPQAAHGAGPRHPVPTLRKRPEKRRFRIGRRQRYAQRLARRRKTPAPGELVQIDTLLVNLRADKAIKHFTAYDPVAKWTLGHAATEASANATKALLAKLIAAPPSRSKVSRSTADPSSWRRSRTVAGQTASNSSSWTAPCPLREG
jgi:hypothetical protein